MIKYLDLDGVIIDSIEECYAISCETYFGYAKFPYNKNEYKKLFFMFRGLVKPAYEYYYLHRSIEQFILGSNVSVDTLFYNNINNNTKVNEMEFEKKFFFTRLLYQQRDYTKWINMNPLTEFGKLLVGKENIDVYIVTTKNKQATELILESFNISVAGIYANDDIKRAGSKGSLISTLMDDIHESTALFIDDAVEHLDTVNDSRITCYFADWGYGKNRNYKVYKY